MSVADCCIILSVTKTQEDIQSTCDGYYTQIDGHVNDRPSDLMTGFVRLTLILREMNKYFHYMDVRNIIESKVMNK